MATDLSPSRRADRAKMAAQLVALARAKGAEAESTSGWPAKDYGPDARTMVRIRHRGASVGITLSRLEAKGSYIVPWCIGTESDATFSNVFGAAVCATVNPYHRRKCMGVYPTWTDTLEYVGRALDCINNGDAFE